MEISEIFHSIEGEGIEIGKPEIFVRLSGCNLRCDWCDTKYTWEEGEEVGINRIMERIFQFPCDNVSITGGEPLLQEEELLKLVKELKESGYWIQINTNGTIYSSEIFESVNLITMDCKCPSSGEESDLEVIENTGKNFGSKSQFKFVISDENDYAYGKDVYSSILSDQVPVIFQLEWSNRDFADDLVELVKRDELGVRVLLQQHKIIWGGERGV